MCQWQTIRNGIVTDTLNPDIGECKTKTRRNEANEPIPLLIASCAEGYGGMERAKTVEETALGNKADGHMLLRLVLLCQPITEARKIYIKQPF